VAWRFANAHVSRLSMAQDSGEILTEVVTKATFDPTWSTGLGPINATDRELYSGCDADAQFHQKIDIGILVDMIILDSTSMELRFRLVR